MVISNMPSTAVVIIVLAMVALTPQGVAAHSTTYITLAAGKTNYGLSYSGSATVRVGSKDVARSCFAISNTAACSPPGDCCKGPSRLAKITIFTNKKCYDKSWSSLQWSLDGTPAKASATSDGRVVVSLAGKGHAKKLCVDVPVSHKCKSIKKLCNGHACKFDLQSATFAKKHGKKAACCTLGKAYLGSSKPPSHPPTKPPSHPPTKPPSHPPTKPPSHPPTKPPSHPPTKPPSKPTKPTKPTTPVASPAKPTTPIASPAKPVTGTCPGVPADAVAKGSWDAAKCAKADTCIATCDTGYGGTPKSTCDKATSKWGPVTGGCKPAVTITTKLTGKAYDPTLDPLLIAAVLKALNLPASYTGDNINIKSLPASVLQIVLASTDQVTLAQLTAATDPKSTFMPFLRNNLPGTWFSSGGSLCYSSTDGTCQGQTYDVIKKLDKCKVNVCFLMDGSGSINGFAGAWAVEINLVDGFIKSIGDPTSKVSVIEFSSTTKTHVATTSPDKADLTALRTALPLSGGTTMAPGLEACFTSLKAMTDAGVPKVLVFLTDGEPTDSSITVTNTAQTIKDAGIKLITIGVASADLPFMAKLSSGPAYAFSAAQFSNNATNLVATVGPTMCGTPAGR